ncbi:unnamed protein product [Lymnaea stagnalis]|uniref:Lysine-specific metallo-endopeptidase domain-containing protein n=1 Tax=Lymnaea stagnalis TaxID=6523 RepID=A0AAV2IC23_LYMST
MSILLLLSLAVAGAAALPFHNNSIPNYHLAAEDFIFLNSLPKGKAGAQIPGFKYRYLDATNHQITPTLIPAHHQLEIAGSPRTSQHAVDVAAGVIQKMTRYMPQSMFESLTRGTVGIFTAAEKLTVFPENKNLASGSCGASCAGTCSHTCTFDGRKYEDIGGLTNSRAVVLDDIVLCTSADPYHHTVNILVHEFAHLVHTYATTAAIRTQITNAYNAAKQHATWQLNTYAMANDHEYWAMASAAFFGVDYEGNSNTGTMNMCGNAVCTTVPLVREHLRQKDPALFSALVHVYANNNPALNPGLTRCPAGTVVG